MITEVKITETLKTPIKQPEHKLVRTDSASRTLDSFLSPKPLISSQVLKIVDFNSESLSAPSPTTEEIKKDLHGKFLKIKVPDLTAKKVEIVDVQLISVLELRQSVENQENSRVTEIFREHAFVGLVDDFRALIQHQTKLLMVDFKQISRILFYQVVLYGFANFSRIIFKSPLNISQVLEAAVAVDPSLVDNNNVDKVCGLLIEKREMLSEYFSLDISPDGDILSLPVLLKGYTPNITKLPKFLIALANNVYLNC
jgi:DNA mismatch repair protein MLH1